MRRGRFFGAMLAEKAYFQLTVPKGLDLILNAISKEVLEQQPPESDLNRTIALYLKRELKMRETNGFSVLDLPKNTESAETA